MLTNTTILRNCHTLKTYIRKLYALYIHQIYNQTKEQPALVYWAIEYRKKTQNIMELKKKGLAGLPTKETEQENKKDFNFWLRVVHETRNKIMITTMACTLYM